MIYLLKQQKVKKITIWALDNRDQKPIIHGQSVMLHVPYYVLRKSFLKIFF